MRSVYKHTLLQRQQRKGKAIVTLTRCQLQSMLCSAQRAAAHRCCCCSPLLLLLLQETLQAAINPQK
jgi:hypothetical protein